MHSMLVSDIRAYHKEDKERHFGLELVIPYIYIISHMSEFL